MTDYPPNPTPGYQTPSSANGLLTQLKIVAICLISTAGISILYNIADGLWRLYGLITGHIPRPIFHLTPEQYRAYRSTLYLYPVLDVLAIILCAIVIVGAISMLRRSNIKLAWTAAILAVIPCTAFCCCILLLPFGIWAIILLTRPAVKAAFPA